MKVQEVLKSGKNKIIILGVFFLLLTGVYVLNNRKQVVITLDGKSEIIETRQVFEGMFANKVSSKKRAKYMVTSKSNEYKLLSSNDRFKFSTEKKIELAINNETKEVSTYSDTIEELLNEEKLSLDSYIIDGLNKDDLLIEHNQIKLIFKEVKNVDETVTENLPVKYQYNNNKYTYQQTVITNGRPKVIIKTFEITYHDGAEVSRTLLEEKVTDNGTQKIVEVGTKKEVIIPASASDSVWDKLAQCESSGNWHVNNGNGYYGGLQFTYDTWLYNAKAVGVTAGRADLASREDQIKVATYLQSVRGWYPWPACSRKLGLLP